MDGDTHWGVILCPCRRNRYLRIDKSNGSVRADSPGPRSDGGRRRALQVEEVE